MLKLGEKIINNLYLGDKKIAKAFLGDKLIFQAGKPIFLDYIESTGTQYIDTGIKPSYEYTIKTKYRYVSYNSDYNCIFGTRWMAQATGNNIYWVGYNTNSKELMMRMGKTTTAYTLKLNEDVELIVNPNDTTVNGTSIGDAMYDGEIGFNLNILLFNLNETTSYFSSSARMYYFQIYDKDMNLIQDLRPCIDVDGIVCMYDMVTRKYFYNQGTGEFIAGKFRFIDYIKSTGTQYIDTGINGAEVTRFVIKGTCVENGLNNTQLIGGNNSSSQTFFGNRFSSSVAHWYCMDSKNTSIGNPHNLSIIDATIESDTSQYGTLTDLVDGTVSEFIKFSGNAWAFSNENLLLFGGNSARRSPNATCYMLQLYTKDGLVRDFVPALDADGVVCMYDKVSREYFYNAGEGEFIGCKPIDIDYTRIYAYISSVDSWATAPDSYSILIPIEVGKKYRLEWETTVGVGSIFRYGQTNIPKPQGQILNSPVRTSPQDTPIADITAVNDYLVIQITGATASVVVENKYLKLYEIP